MSVTVTALKSIGGMITLGNKLQDKFPDYKEKIGKDWNECVLKYESYKSRPREKRISHYIFALKKEVDNHIIKAGEYIK